MDGACCRKRFNRFSSLAFLGVAGFVFFFDGEASSWSCASLALSFALDGVMVAALLRFFDSFGGFAGDEASPGESNVFSSIVAIS